jgi:hypothetical protein
MIENQRAIELIKQKTEATIAAFEALSLYCVLIPLFAKLSAVKSLFIKKVSKFGDLTTLPSYSIIAEKILIKANIH